MLENEKSPISKLDLTYGLNEEQKEAVEAAPSNQLIIAGAGSGKTRVLAHRIAYLIERLNYRPSELMAVTFTNKAARVLASRIEELIGIPTQRQWIGTFHGLANRMLHRHHEKAKLPQNFQILDVEGQKRVLKRLMGLEHADPYHPDETLGLPGFEPQDIATWISRQKDEGYRSEHIQPDRRRDTADRIEVYQAYDDYCQTHGLVDFGEILLRCQELLLENDEILEQYQDRFRYILVDEFQDTNAIQYKWIQLLAGPNTHVLAVGDDDQSIYGWRGAVVANIRSFKDDFDNTKVTRLEQNYRSTGNILNAANQLIARNNDRLGKTLWTKAEDGPPVNLYMCDTAETEASYVLFRVQEWIEADVATRNYDEIAVLYRSHFQSRNIEQALTSLGIPYTIRGGARFYERTEVRDTIAYMQLMANPHAEIAFDRALNHRPRGFGSSSQTKLFALATRRQCSHWEAAKIALEEGSFAPAQTRALSSFVSEITRLRIKCQNLPLDKVAEACVYDSGVLQHFLDTERSEQTRINRRENLQELISACKSYEAKMMQNVDDSDRASVLRAFLDSVSLDAGDVEEEVESSVSLMTLHAAKGLEFPMVIIIGMTEGIFPHWRSIQDAKKNHDEKGLFEERRLAYVGLTRAMKELHLTHVPSDRDYTREIRRVEDGLSRFVREIPAQFLNVDGNQF